MALAAKDKLKHFRASIYLHIGRKDEQTNASAGNRARVTSMATMYSTTRPLMLILNRSTRGARSSHVTKRWTLAPDFELWETGQADLCFTQGMIAFSTATLVKLEDMFLRLQVLSGVVAGHCAGMHDASKRCVCIARRAW